MMIVIAWMLTLALGLDVVLMSFNIRSGSGIDNSYNLTRTAGVIRDVMGKADEEAVFFVGLQEVDNRTKRHPQDQPQFLAKATALTATYGKMRDFEGGGYGVCVLSSHVPEKRVIFHYNGTSPAKCHDTEPRDFCQGDYVSFFVCPSS